MNKVSLQKAIQSGAWYECDGKYFDEARPYRMRVLGFNRTSVEEIDGALASQVQIEGVLWLLYVEVVNLSKKSVSAWEIAETLVIIDEDGFQFDRFYDSDLDGNKNSGLYRFSGWSGNPPLSPKIKASGSIAFVLPDEETNYYISIKDGQIREA